MSRQALWYTIKEKAMNRFLFFSIYFIIENLHNIEGGHCKIKVEFQDFQDSLRIFFNQNENFPVLQDAFPGLKSIPGFQDYWPPLIQYRSYAERNGGRGYINLRMSRSAFESSLNLNLLI